MQADIDYTANDQLGSNFAPADFQDATSPDRPAHTITNSVNNVILYHVSDIGDKSQQTRQWRKKVRDIIQNHQENIIQFFTNPLPSSHPLKVAHTILVKYGKASTINLDRSPQYFKDFIKDPSGNGFLALNEYISELEVARASESPLIRWSSMTRHMLDYMRDVGDELLRIDQRLQNECSLLDTVVEKVGHLISLENPGVDGFEETMEAYIQKQFEKHPIESLYWDYIYTIQKYSGLRDILIPQRTAATNEPVCNICMTEVAIMAFAPCGHTFCTNCAKRTSICHVCRQGIVSRIRIYFG
jgi:hypothetical protein